MKQKILKLMFVMSNFILPLIFLITNGREKLILLYPAVTVVLLLIITSFNSYYIYHAKGKLLIIPVISIFIAYPLAFIFPILYVLMLLAYLIMFSTKKNVVIITLCAVLSGITIINIIKSNYIKISKENFSIVGKKVDLGFSPSKKYYGYCIENKFYMHEKLDIIGILDDFSGILEKSISISVCDKTKIKWKSDEELQVNGEIIKIIDEGVKFENGERVTK